jgi:hypothetical protein
MAAVVLRIPATHKECDTWREVQARIVGIHCYERIILPNQCAIITDVTLQRSIVRVRCSKSVRLMRVYPATLRSALARAN